MRPVPPGRMGPIRIPKIPERTVTVTKLARPLLMAASLWLTAEGVRYWQDGFDAAARGATAAAAIALALAICTPHRSNQ